jgi:hypothetical protein
LNPSNANMKQHHHLRQWAFLLPVLLLAAACHKEAAPPPPRSVTYVLYTEKDFSNNLDTIRFEILMKSGSQILLDSPLAPMTIAQVPGIANKISISKNVPEANRNDDLVVGFLYQIDNVGYSWFLDSSKAGNETKTVTYKFE